MTQMSESTARPVRTDEKPNMIELIVRFLIESESLTKSFDWKYNGVLSSKIWIK